MTSKKSNQLKVAVVIASVGILLLCAQSAAASQSSASPEGELNPTLESLSETFAFIRWATSNPGGTILHYAVVHYGADPDHLDRTAKSPTRINPAHGDMIFRVRVNDLHPGTTYYYRVSSEQANGALDPGTSTIKKFTTRTVGERALQ